MVTNNIKLGEVVPCLRYRDAKAAIAFLQDAFGLHPQLVVPGEGDLVVHAQLTIGNGMVMVGSDDPDSGRLVWPVGAGCVYVIVDDLRAHHDKAVAAGAEIVLPYAAQDHGGESYTARDPEGNLWSFGTYRPEV
jgi:uncharacterized glyoxalase superfamily protein PhnB